MPHDIYHELAAWWPLFSAPADYAEEAEIYRRLLQDACAPKSLLELGSGGGNNASHMKAHFELTLVDQSPGMLQVSQELNPECSHFEGDMRDVRLGRTFDAVFIHDAIGYLTSRRDLARALETAFLHCKPGGVALLVPDDLQENFAEQSEMGGHDGEGRSLRYLAWSNDADPNDEVIETDYAFLLREGDRVRVVHERHLQGLFSQETWLRLCTEAGFEPEIRSYALSEPAGSYETFLCRKPV